MGEQTNKYIWGRTKQLILVVLLVLLFRIIYVDLYQYLQINYNIHLSGYIRLFFKDLLTLLVSAAGNVLFVWLLKNKITHKGKPFARNLITLSYILLISAIGALLLNRPGLAENAQTDWHIGRFVISYLAVLLINAVFVICSDLFLYFRETRNAIKLESDKKRKAQYQYHQLKQQLNPHFLFNCLNVLDYLVQNGESRRASDFIRKMASVYRYLLDTGENRLVPLNEELHLVEMYTDLLKERFPEGLFLHIDVPDERRQSQVIPCGLQILVENAVKHNIVSTDCPLHIHIGVKGNRVFVQNNIRPRMTQDSTGVGLANIQKQYNDIAGKNIRVRKKEDVFIVELPLL